MVFQKGFNLVIGFTEVFPVFSQGLKEPLGHILVKALSFEAQIDSFEALKV